MMSQTWLDKVLLAEKTCLVEDGVRKVHFKFAEGEGEMVDEYNMSTNVLTRRIWKIPKPMGGPNDQWEVEIGDPIPEAQQQNLETLGIRENPNAPFITRRITKNSLEWRIRNLPYPIETYSVTAEPENYCITVRTSNKKYFKKLPTPDLRRAGLVPEQSKIQFTHKFNTLIIIYQKPPAVLKLEAAIFEEVKKLKPSKAGDMPACNPS